VLHEQQNVWKLVSYVFGEGKMCDLTILHYKSNRMLRISVVCFGGRKIAWILHYKSNRMLEDSCVPLLREERLCK